MIYRRAVNAAVGIVPVALADALAPTDGGYDHLRALNAWEQCFRGGCLNRNPRKIKLNALKGAISYGIKKTNNWLPSFRAALIQENMTLLLEQNQGLVMLIATSIYIKSYG